MLAAIPAFYADARRLLRAPGQDALTFGEFLARGRYRRYFISHFAVPLVAAVWSYPPANALNYPARYLFEFLGHHGMLSVARSGGWRTVVGGSRDYVEPDRHADIRPLLRPGPGHQMFHRQHQMGRSRATVPPASEESDEHARPVSPRPAHAKGDASRRSHGSWASGGIRRERQGLRTVASPGIWSAEELGNGNWLCCGSRYVHEVDPKGNIVWQFTPADIPDYKVAQFQIATRLPNGNTIVNNWINQWDKNYDLAESPAQAWEVTPAKEDVVWALRAWTPPDNLGPATTIQILDTPTVPGYVHFGSIK